MLHIRPIMAADLPALRAFTDQEIGAGYYSDREWLSILERSKLNDVMCSLLLEDRAGQVKGVRISFPPGQWEHGKGRGLRPDLWPHDFKDTAYFQSLFVAKDLQGQGWGGKLSEQAIATLRAHGAKGIVCHSWQESPHNSSTRYLQKLGFNVVAEHKEYWRDVDYQCPRCGQPPCLCTALEMYLNLEEGA